MREVLAGAAAGDEPASTRAATSTSTGSGRAIAAMAASLGGLDALVFTGGVGERSAPIRAMAADGLGFLGVAVDAARNEAPGDGDREVSPDGAAVARGSFPHARTSRSPARCGRR